MTNISEQEEGRIFFLGFPFSPVMKSPYTGLENGPLVIDEIIKRANRKAVIISSSARYYASDPMIAPLEHVRAFNGAGESIEPVSEIEWNAIALLEPILLEMLGQRTGQVKKEAYLPSHLAFEDRRRRVRNKFSYWSETLKSGRVIAYVNSNVPHLTDDLIIYALCRNFKIPTIFPYRMPIVPGVSARLYFPVSLYDHSRVYDDRGAVISAMDISTEQAREDLPEDLALIYREVVENGKSLSDLSREALRTSAMKAPVLFSRKLIKGQSGGLKAALRGLLSGDLTTYRMQQALRKVNNQNAIAYQRLAKTHLPEDPFVYFPLHMQPEASSCPLGGFYSDQLRAIRLLSSAMPNGWRLVVKEHPHQQMALRLPGWYEDILKSPNVELISMDASSEDLQRKCRAVATLTGTAAWEAWLWQKPSIVLGHILFQEAPGIYKVRSLTDAVEALQGIAAGEVHSRQDIRDFLGRLAQMTVWGHLDAYIDPCLPIDRLDPEQNEREIGRRMINALFVQGLGQMKFRESPTIDMVAGIGNSRDQESAW